MLFELLMQDTTILPRLRPAIIALLEELPDSLNGVGASEQLMLESLSYGCTDPGQALYAVRDRSVINEREAGDLFDELAQCPEPLVFGLGEGPKKSSHIFIFIPLYLAVRYLNALARKKIRYYELTLP